MYNGYKDQDAFHEAMAEGQKEYAKALEEAAANNWKGWEHAFCDHGNGYCQNDYVVSAEDFEKAKKIAKEAAEAKKYFDDHFKIVVIN
jgi:hypothetical protein